MEAVRRRGTHFVRMDSFILSHREEGRKQKKTTPFYDFFHCIITPVTDGVSIADINARTFLFNAVFPMQSFTIRKNYDIILLTIIVAQKNRLFAAK